jgi:nanoRNase/pAp phosphatase (c-di-AMP/oligoRNAs hydrolase)
VDVGAVARRFGGGGHRLAAGYTTPRRPQEARKELLEILRTTSSVDLGGRR